MYLKVSVGSGRFEDVTAFMLSAEIFAINLCMKSSMRLFNRLLKSTLIE